jgi:fatty-acyl-CoA synthase
MNNGKSADLSNDISKVCHNPLTPLDFLKRCELVFPDKKAVVYRDKCYTWKEFAGRVYRLTNGLIQHGIKKGDRVAILSRNNNANLEAYYGIAMAGGVCVPLNYRLMSKEVNYILNHSGSKALFTEHLYADSLKDIRKEFQTVEFIIEVDSFDKLDGEFIGIPYEEFLNAAPDISREVPVEDENEMLSICYTSGTTGLPKGCIHTHRGSYLNALGEAIEARLTPESSYLWTLPMFHSQGWSFVWAVTAVGAKHVCLDAVRADQIYELMSKEKVTHMCGAPTACSMITDYMKQNNLKFAETVRGFIAGAPPSAGNFHDGWEMGLDLHQVYGLTEVYGPHTICEWNEEKWAGVDEEQKIKLRLRQGVPYVTCTQVKVVDENMKEVPWNGSTSGEIIMRGNNVMQGYFRDEERTKEVFEGGWFHTGDSAVVDPDGYIRIVDRIKDLVVTGGEKVASVEVEAAIKEHPAVQDVAVIGKPDQKWGEIVKAIVQVRDGQEITAQEITQWCKARLAGFKTPREVEFAEIPRTATGKVQKNILKQREMDMVTAN